MRETRNECRIVVKKRDRLENLGVDGRRLLKFVLKKLDGRLWNEFMWLRVGTFSGFMRTRLMTSRCHKTRISCLAEELSSFLRMGILACACSGLSMKLESNLFHKNVAY
jgi:hypothetical protein